MKGSFYRNIYFLTAIQWKHLKTSLDFMLSNAENIATNERLEFSTVNIYSKGARILFLAQI